MAVPGKKMILFASLMTCAACGWADTCVDDNILMQVGFPDEANVSLSNKDVDDDDYHNDDDDDDYYHHDDDDDNEASARYGDGSTAPTPTSAVSATGDPHLRNVLGQRFDLMQPGNHTLVNIPKGSLPQDALFRIRAHAAHLGSDCVDMYFQVLNVTGHWMETTVPSGLHFHAGSGSDENLARWMHVGPVELKVVRGHMLDGTAYLNLFLKNVRKTGYHVGGLLGEDDHEEEATPSASCKDRLKLLEVMPSDVSFDSPSQAMFGSIAKVLAE
jgi:hypothetical protein